MQNQGKTTHVTQCSTEHGPGGYTVGAASQSREAERSSSTQSATPDPRWGPRNWQELLRAGQGMRAETGTPGTGDTGSGRVRGPGEVAGGAAPTPGLEDKQLEGGQTMGIAGQGQRWPCSPRYPRTQRAAGVYLLKPE